MTYYYKRIDENGNVVSLITCDQYLAESAEQIEITEEEYAELCVALIPPDESETNEATEADYIESLEELGVTFNE